MPEMGGPSEQDIAILAMMPPDLLTEEEADLMEDENEPEFDTSDPLVFDVNLAQFLDEAKANRLADNVVEWVAVDQRSRLDWEEREASGIQLLGVTKSTLGGAEFEGASKSVHPGLAKACIQFQARAMAELWPSGGPCKAIVLGATSPEREQQAERVSNFLNYQYEYQMPGAFEEHDSMLFRLPLSGSCFKKIYYDPLEETNVSRFVESSDFYVPYAASDLRSAPRFTHKLRVVRNDLRKLIAEGYYLDAVDNAPLEESLDHERIDETIDDAEGRIPEESRAEHEAEYDQRDVLLECYCYLDLRDYDYEDPLASDGYGDPYVVTVHKDDRALLSIRRNWQEDDEKKRRRLFFTHYKFLPGLGFYGFGFLHLAGGLSSAQTGALRSLMDAAALSNLKGGWRSSDLRIKKGEERIRMGEWIPVEASAEEVAKGFYTPPYSEPSKTLFELLGWMDKSLDSLVSTTESMVGEENQSVPVGTTLARIEQGLKVFSGIHRRCHAAQKQEFGILASLNADYLPPEYPYDLPGESRTIMATDFDERVDVIPVSDPNTVTNSQRIARAQGVWELSAAAPDLINRRQALKVLLEALRIEEIDQILPDPGETPRRDPVSEGAAMMRGEPVMAAPDQDHAAHLAVHAAWWATVPPERQQVMAPIYMAHDGEHRAELYKLQMQQAMGMPLPQGPVDPLQDAQISQQAALAIQQGPIGMPVGQPDPSQMAAQAQDAKVAHEIQLKDAMGQAEIQRADRKAQADIQREMAADIAKSLMEGSRMSDATDKLSGRPPPVQNQANQFMRGPLG